MCLNNLKQLQLAWLLYNDDNDGKIVNGEAYEGGAVRPPCLQEAGIKASFGGRVMTARAVSGQDRSCRTRFR